MTSLYLADPEANYHQLCETAAMAADQLLEVIEVDKKIQSMLDSGEEEDTYRRPGRTNAYPRRYVSDDFDAEYEEASIHVIASALACARFRASHTPTVNINGDVIYSET